MSVSIDIADAVVAELNAASLSQSFTATREYVPSFVPSEQSGTVIYVIPGEIAQIRESRDSYQEEVAIGIGIYKTVSVVDKSTVDAMVTFTEQVADLFRLSGLQGYAGATVVEVKNSLYEPSALDQHKTYASLITLVYRLFR
jgi:hypothetical protein